MAEVQASFAVMPGERRAARAFEPSEHRSQTERCGRRHRASPPAQTCRVLCLLSTVILTVSFARESENLNENGKRKTKEIN